MREQYLEKIGNVLKNKREEKGLSIHDVATAIKINADYIRGLEDYRIEVFPAEIFFKGFLKNYAAYLELNALELLNEYQKLRGTGNELSKTVSQKEKNRSINTSVIKYGVIIFIFGLIVFSWLRVSYINYQKKSELEKRIATNFNTMTTAKELSLHEEKKKILDSAQKNELVKIKVTDNCWVEVKVDNTKIFQGLLGQGDEREFPYKKGMVFKVGNAGAVELYVKGEKKADYGRKGEVKEFVVE